MMRRAYNVILSSRSPERVNAFLDYAFDSEGMSFCQVRRPNGAVDVVSYGNNYAPECVRAVVRNFRESFGR